MFGKVATPIKRSETVTVKVLNVNNRQYRFSDSETILSGRKFKAMIVHSESLVKTVDNDPIVPNAIQKRGYLTLSDKDNNQFIKRLPLESFFNDNGVIFLELADLNVDLRKSFIDLSDTTGLTADMAFVITFFFD